MKCLKLKVVPAMRNYIALVFVPLILTTPVWASGIGENATIRNTANNFPTELFYFDENQNGQIDSFEIQAVVNYSLGVRPNHTIHPAPGNQFPLCMDYNEDGKIDAVDVQAVRNVALGTSPMKKCRVRLYLVGDADAHDDSCSVSNGQAIQTSKHLATGVECKIPQPAGADNGGLGPRFNPNAEWIIAQGFFKKRPQLDGYAYCTAWVRFSGNVLLYNDTFLFEDLAANVKGVKLQIKKALYSLYVSFPRYGYIADNADVSRHNVRVNLFDRIHSSSPCEGPLCRILGYYSAVVNSSNEYVDTELGVIERKKLNPITSLRHLHRSGGGAHTSGAYTTTEDPIYSIQDTVEINPVSTVDGKIKNDQPLISVWQIGTNTIKLFAGQHGYMSFIELNP